nr:hypothetical protein [Candidatus Cloacimonadota bacterium]
MQFNGQSYVQDKDGGWVLTDAPVYATAPAVTQLKAVEKETAAEAIEKLRLRDLENLGLGETPATAYRGDRGAIAYAHATSSGNPHGLTLESLGYTAPEGSTGSNEKVYELDGNTSGLGIAYRFITAPGGTITCDGLTVTTLDEGVPVVGDLWDNQITGTKSLFMSSEPGAEPSWEDIGTRDWTLPSYKLGANQETVLYVKNSWTSYGNLDVIRMHPNMNDITIYPIGTKVSIISNSDTDRLVINMDGLSRAFSARFLINDYSFPMSGYGLHIGAQSELVLCQLSNDPDQGAIWGTENEALKSGNSDVDGWGNACVPSSRLRYQRYTLSETQYNAITGIPSPKWITPGTDIEVKNGMKMYFDNTVTPGFNINLPDEAVDGFTAT